MPMFSGPRTGIPPALGSTLRLRWGPTQPRRTLDGAWWPRSGDPVAELPGLILALDDLHSPITTVILSHAGWDSRPARLAVADRVVRLIWFTNLPVGLLTAICRDGDRVDVLVVPPRTVLDVAEVAMALAAEATNTLRTPEILYAANLRHVRQVEAAAHTGWESEGGHVKAGP